MNNDMQIMREFDNLWAKIHGIEDGHEILDKVQTWLPEAVRREICRAVFWIKRDIYRTENKHYFAECSGEVMKNKMVEIIEKHYKKYSPAPRYCEGMQEAIDKGVIHILVLDGEANFYMQYRNGDRRLKRCPFCSDGENCLEDKT